MHKGRHLRGATPKAKPMANRYAKRAKEIANKNVYKYQKGKGY